MLWLHSTAKKKRRKRKCEHCGCKIDSYNSACEMKKKVEKKEKEGKIDVAVSADIHRNSAAFSVLCKIS